MILDYEDALARADANERKRFVGVYIGQTEAWGRCHMRGSIDQGQLLLRTKHCVP